MKIVHTPAFVMAASVSGRLHRIMSVAKAMSLSAKNAKAIAARAGDKALGFRPITDFINEMARETIDYVTRINNEALKLSRNSVQHVRYQDAMHRYQITHDRLDSAGDSKIGAVLAQSSRHTHEIHTIAGKATNNLIELLSEINQRMRAAEVIATNSRVEASRAEEFQENLEVIAENIEKATGKIKKEVHYCEKILHKLKNEMRKKQ